MAGTITEATVEEIKNRTDIADLIASYGIHIVSAGSSKKACCPFHNEKTPSFHINERKGFYHCFGCGESGDAIKFVQKMDGLSFVDAVKKLAQQCGVKIEEKAEDPAAGQRKRLFALLAELAQFYRRCLLKTKEAEGARAYLEERALAGEIAEKYLIGYAPSGVANVLTWGEKHGYTLDDLALAGVIKPPDKPTDKGYHRFGGRLMFTICDRQGRVVGFSGRQLVASKNSGKYVNSPETPVFKKSNVLYGFDKAASAITRAAHREAIVCEGQIDCIRLQTSGFPNAVAGQGTAFTQEHARMLKRAADQVVLVYDDDGAGHKATIKTARLCLAVELPVRVVSLPGGDDPDSFLRTHPADDFQKMLDNAESIMAFQVRAERAKERTPDTVDAMARITRELLTTIAQSPNEVLKAAMLGEAAKLLGIPVMALRDELGKVRVERPRVQEAVAADETSEPSASAETAETSVCAATPQEIADALPPPQHEMAFCAFLMGHEYDKTLDGIIGEFLPPSVFFHAFTQRFVDVWRVETSCGEDKIGAWSETLDPVSRRWFDAMLTNQEIAQKSGRTLTDIMQDFVRNLWSDALTRELGDLPNAGTLEEEDRKLKITVKRRAFSDGRWSDVKAFIRELKAR